MEIGQASEVLTLLAAAFPRRWRNAPAEETQLWIEFLSTLDYQPGRDTAGRLIRTATDMPSIAEFRQVYAAVRIDIPGARPALAEEYPNDPQTSAQWEDQAKRHRAWRKETYPDTDDPATDKPLPRNREQLGTEWAAWFMVHFGWAPGGAQVGEPL